jgi:flagellar M-ring protein FliF
MVEKIEAMLAMVLGPGQVRAQVSADMSFDQIDRTVETYDPDGQVLQSEQRSESAAGADASGDVVISNAYQNSRRLERSLSGAGKIQQLTAAVLVDEQTLASAFQGTDPAEGARRLETMVKDAIGASETRGDRVSVLAVPFEKTAPPAEVTEGKTAKPPFDLMMTMDRVVKPIAGIVAIVALLLVALRLMRPAAAPAPARRAEIREMVAGTAAEPAAAHLPATLPPADLKEVEMLTSSLLSEPIERPELAAQVMRNWLSEKP